MSSLDRRVPPAGEELHIPGPSAQPLLLTIGITAALLGVTINSFLLVAGLILTVWVTLAWIRDARREYAHLPLEHHPETQETVPRPQDRPHPASPQVGS